MNKSDSISSLAAALSLAQAEFKGAIADSLNPFFKSKYADLGSVWDAVRIPLTKNGLSVTQLTDCSEINATYLETVLLHKSGEWIASTLPILMKEQSAQAMGSAISYARRYALSAILGIYQSDDDGNAAQGHKPHPTAPITTPSSPLQHMLITEKQGKRLWAIANANGYDEADLKAYLFMECGYDSIRDIKVTDYDKICKHIEQNPVQAGLKL